MKTKFTVILIIIISLTASISVKAQEVNDSITIDWRRNVIKWNMTPFLLWSSKNINLSYERAISPHRSFSVNAGYFEIPFIGSYDILRIDAARKRGGFSTSGDYRMYFKNRNTAYAPDGLYWGPYGSWHRYGFTNDFTVSTNTGTSGQLTFEGNFNVFSLGMQLGYQFVIKEKFTVDLIFMGPSASLYSAKLTLDGDIDVNEENEYLEAIRDMLVSKFPFLEDLVNKREFNAKGITSGLGPGMRYMIQIGYAF
jgi:hypothetical protein